jgi:hypothetical protein
VEQLEEPSPNVHWDSHDDALGHPCKQPESGSELLNVQGDFHMLGGG